MRALFLTLPLAVGCAHPSPVIRSEPGPDASTASTLEPPPNPNTTEPLVCNEAEPCRSLADEIATQCAKQNQTVRQGSCGALQVLIIETDPESVTFTSTKRYYDAGGKLVAHQIFVNEYGRTITYGTLAPCSIQSPTPVCPAK